MDQPVPGARLVVDALPKAGASCRISGEEAAHGRARRLRAGDAVVLVDGSGREALGRLTSIGPRAIDVLIDAVRPAAEEALAPIHLLVAAVRAERLSWIAEKATEFGARRLTLVATDRTQRFRASAALVPRLSRVAREAAKQAESARWPAVSGPIELDDVLASETSQNRLVLDSSGDPFPSTLPRVSTALLIGPEGGWTDPELEAALARGWIAAALSAGKLRAETAAVAALALARAALARTDI